MPPNRKATAKTASAPLCSDGKSHFLRILVPTGITSKTAYEEKIYRTGDLVQYNERGELIYLSRKDFQIKHMGHRIELGEIETAASSLPEITMCCCLYDEKKSRIVLFLDKELTREEIGERLRAMIPEYMLPGRVVYMEDMPLNANGKIDRVKLKEYL